MAVDQNWRFDGTSLQTLAFNLRTFGGRTVMSGRRGANVVVPYRYGTIFVPKFYQERKLQLAMWVIGADPVTGVVPADPSDQFWTNVRTLQRLFVTDRQPGTLTKRHPVKDADVAALAEVADRIDFTTQPGATRAAFVVDLVLPEVWFEDLTLQGDTGYTSRADLDTWAEVLDSDVRVFDPIISIKATTGTPANIVLTNTTLGTDYWIKYADVLATGEEIVIDVGAWTAILDGTTNVVNNVQWSGQPQFFELAPGSNTIKCEVTGGPVDIKIQWKGKYW